MRLGYTLLELVFVLTIVVAGFTVLAPAYRRAQERLIVRSARESLIGLIVRTQALAVVHGGATLTLEVDPAGASLEAGGEVRDTLSLTALGVVMDLVRGKPQARLRFNSLGIGELAGQTVGLSRGSARAGIVVSAYGRVRRW
ncbi:MAG: hypothetical protein BMS9Abin29_0597 [Gemmatimonadota bacterium]|nr:MAG: hypothetical protein BMS9Abin29_0597 [Gemmatimonadota bacterium]